MEIRREQSNIVDRLNYEVIKNNLHIHSDGYTRKCCFIREIIFGDGKEKEDKVQFSIRLNRNNHNEILLSEKYYNNGIVNCSETRLTRLQALHIVYGDLTYMETSDNPVIQQLYMYMKYNHFQVISFREYFEENYYSVCDTDIINIKSMELLIENDSTEFFSERLTPVRDIDYNRIEINMLQKIEVPAMIHAG